MKHLVVLAGSAAVLLGVVACGGPTSGQPIPATTTVGTAPDDAPTADTSTSSGGPNSLPVDQPCSLLSPSDLHQIGVSTQPTQGMVGTAHACEFDTADDHLIVGIRTNSGLADLTGPAPVSGIRVGRHAAKQMKEDSASSCLVAMGVSDSSRVDVTATGDGTKDPCPAALAVAQLVESKLP